VADEGFPQNVLPVLSRTATQAPVLALPPLDAHLDVLSAIAFDRELLGSSPDAIASATAPAALRALPRFKVIRFADVRLRATLRFRAARLVFGAWTRKRYLRKPIRGSGGQGIDWWTPGGRLDDAHYLQEHIPGIAMSAIYRGDGWSSVLLGVVEQLVGEAWCEAGPWQPCGAIGPVPLSEQSRTDLGHLGAALTQRHDLRGLFAIDLVQDRRGRLWPIEVNPHYTDDVAVLETALGFAALSGAGPMIRQGRHRRAAGPAWAGQARIANEVVSAQGASRDEVEARLKQAAETRASRGAS
jgi:predicted ATP-grasp superfamily ATP-dependent carboligase